MPNLIVFLFHLLAYRSKTKNFMAPHILEPAKVEGDPEEFENRNVHTIYDEIAAHFSSTRYKVTASLALLHFILNFW